MPHSYDARPAPTTGGRWGSDEQRWRQGEKRFRMLRGLWDQDLEDALLKQHGATGRAELGPRSKSKNLLRDVCEQLAVLYVKTPNIAHESGLDLTELVDELATLWPGQTYLQTVTLAEREGLKLITWGETGPVYETVHPHEVVACPMPLDPTTPGAVRRLLWFSADEVKGIEPGEAGVWAWEAWDIRGEAEYGVYEHSTTDADNMGRRLTLTSREPVEGYPWVLDDGSPFLPWQLYHAEDPSELWDPYRWVELVDATLDVGCLITQFLHLMFRASYTLKYTIGLVPAGITTTRDTNNAHTATVQTGMTAVVQFMDATNTAGNPGRVGQFDPAASPTEYMTAIQKYMTSVASVAGIDAAHIVRESADAWSGAALTVDREGKREAQGVYAPQFAPADAELVGKIAAMINLNTGSKWPTSGYRVSYQALPLTPQEETERRAFAKEMVTDGHWSKIDAHRYLNPGMTRTEAILDLRRIEVDAVMIAAAAGGGADDLAKTALNGAQVTAAQAIVESVAAGGIPRETGEEMLVQFFQLDAAAVAAMLGPVEINPEEDEE